MKTTPVKTKSVSKTAIKGTQKQRDLSEINRKQLRNIFQHVPAATAVLEGPEHTYILANKAYQKLFNRKEKDFFGKSIHEVFPELKDSGAFELVDRVFETGESFTTPEYALYVDAHNEGVLRQNFYEFSMEPLKNDSGEIYAVIAMIYDVTEQIESRKKVEASEKRYNMMLMQSPYAIAVLKGKDKVVAMANDSIKQMWGKGNNIEGKPLLEVLPEINDQEFPALLDKVYTTGDAYVLNESLAQLNRKGKMEDVYFNYVYQPYRETDDTISGVTIIAIEVTEQVLARKKIEENEKQQAFLLKLSDGLRTPSDPVEIEAIATKIALDFMDADRCYYNTLEEGNAIVLRDAFRVGLTSLAGMYPISNFPLFKAVVDAGRPFVVDDVYTSDIIEEGLRQICVQVQVISMINIPIIKSGKPVGVLSLVQSKPRKWTETEIQLTIETAERTWAAIERAKAEHALQQSEEKYRTLFTSMDQGFTLCELIRNKEGKGIDFSMLEVNPTYEEQTGIRKEMVLGKALLQVFPSLDKWIDNFADVVDNQRPVVFENYIEETDSWYAIKAYPVEKERFAILYSNITERKQAEAKLKASEKEIREVKEQLELSIRAGKIGVWYWDVKKDILTWSNEQKEMYGFSASEVVYKAAQFNSLIFPEDMKRIQVDQSKGILDHEYDFRIRRKNDGEVRWIKSRARNSFDPQGVLHSISGVNIDVTEQVLAFNKIEESEKQLEFDLVAEKKLQTISTQLIHEKDINLLYEQLVDAAMAVMRSDMASIQLYYPETNKLKLLTHKGFHPLSAAYWDWITTESTSVCCAAMKNGERSMVSDLEKDKRTGETGDMHYYQLSGIKAMQSTPLVSRTGDLVGMISTHWREQHQPSDRELQLFDVLARQAADLIERKKSEEKIIESEHEIRNVKEQLELSIKAGKIGVWHWDVKKDILTWSKEQNEMYGFSHSEVITNAAQFNALIVPEDLNRIQFDQKDGNISDHEYDFRIIRKNDGEVRWIRSKARNSFDPQGVLHSISGVNIDVTEQVLTLNKIQESESRFRSMADASPVLIWTLDANGWSSYYNKTFVDFIGSSKDDDKSDWKKIVHPDDFQSTFDTINTAIAKQSSYTLKCRLLRADGQWRWVLCQGNPRMDVNNAFLGFVGSGVDFTEQNETEEALELQKQKLESVTENTDMALFLMDEKQFCIYMNQAAEKMTGFTMKELKGKQLHYYVHHTHPDGSPFPLEECLIDQALPSQNRMKGEEFFVHKDGFFYSVAFTASPIMFNGITIGTVLEVRETTEDKKKEQELKDSESMFRNLAETLPQMIWVMNGDGRLEYGSKNWKEYSGIDDVAEAWNYMMHPDDRVRLTESWQEAFTKGNGFQNEVRLKSKKGVYRWFYSVGEPVLDADGKVSKWVGSLSDIHEQKFIEEMLEIEVAVRTKELKQKNLELQNMNHELEAFNYISSHDLQEPLRKIQTFAGRIIAKEKDLSISGKDYFSRIQNAASRMQQLIQDLLLFSRVSTSERKFELTGITKLVNEVKEELKEVIEAKHAFIQATDTCEVTIIPFQFRQLIHNLISNALKYSMADVPPRIIIKSIIAKGLDINSDKLLPDTKYCHISFADNGIGFDQIFSEKIFGVFQRLHGKEEYAGTGIGLAIVNKIVENHNGFVTAVSELGKGATFNIYLPHIQSQPMSMPAAV